MKRIFSTVTLSILVSLSTLTHADQSVEKKSNFYKYLVIGGTITGLAGLAYWHKEALNEAVQSGAKKAQEFLPTQETINAKLSILSEALPTKESFNKALSTLGSYVPTLPTKDGITEKVSSLMSYIPSKEELRLSKPSMAILGSWHYLQILYRKNFVWNKQ